MKRRPTPRRQRPSDREVDLARRVERQAADLGWTVRRFADSNTLMLVRGHQLLVVEPATDNRVVDFERIALLEAMVDVDEVRRLVVRPRTEYKLLEILRGADSIVDAGGRVL